MAQAGFTPIQLYFSTTASATPSAGNLANGELAINITDGRLFYKDNGGTVRVLAGTGGSGVVAGSNTQVQFNNNGVFGASANMVFNGTRLTVADFADSSLTAGRVTYAGTGGNLSDSSAFVWDAVNSRLGINSASPIDRLTVGGPFVSTGQTFLTSSNSCAILDYDVSTSEARLFGATPTGSMVGLWTNSNSGALLRRVYLDGLGRIRISTDNSVGTSAPQAWSTTQSVFELGSGGAWNASNSVGGTMSMTSNAYVNTSSAWIARASGYSSRFDLLGANDGAVTFSTTANTATAGGTITWDNTLTLDRNNLLELKTTSGLVGSTFRISNPNTGNYSVLALQNTGASGRQYQLGVAGSTAGAGLANCLYIFDGTAAATRMAMNSSGQTAFGTTTFTAFMNLYSPNSDGSSMLIENGGNNDCGIRTKTALGDYKFGTGIGSAANAFVIYDIGASTQRIRVNSEGNTTVGSSTSAIAKLAVQVASSNGNVSDWGGGQLVVTRGGDTRGNGLGFSVDDVDNGASNISALHPAVAWKKLNIRASELMFLANGDQTALFFDSSFRQPSTPFRHAFKVRNPQGTSLASGATLVFSTVDLNQGSRYSSGTGRFTAAVAGLYHFSHTALTFNVTNYFYGSFQVNGGTQYVAWHTPVTSPDYQGYGISMTVYLNAGDYVTVVTQYNGGTPSVEGGTSVSRTTFSGHFVG